MTREDLGTAYRALIGYNPFDDNPDTNTQAIAEMLRDYLTEALEEDSL